MFNINVPDLAELKKSYDYFKQQYDLATKNNTKNEIQNALGNMANITNAHRSQSLRAFRRARPSLISYRKGGHSKCI